MADASGSSRSHSRERMLVGLLEPSAYPHPVDEIRMIETHISNLFLTGRHVYKIKKPVDLGFLDYTSAEARRSFTLLELELNRRLTTDVHLGVVPVTLDNSGAYQMDGEGQTVEHALKMRQLPGEASLSSRLAAGLISETHVRQLARVIADFHGRARIAPDLATLGGGDSGRANALENIDQLRPHVGHTLSRVDWEDLAAYTEAFLEAGAELLERRAATGRVRECHGDLHAGNIFLEPAGDEERFQIIDCIEFSERLRFIDVAADLAFLTMDLDHAGHPEMASVLVDAYLDRSGDPDLHRLLTFYEVYRALVKTKILSLLAEDDSLTAVKRAESAAAARGYTSLALRRLKAERPQALIVLAGTVGSGKSTIGRCLARRWGFDHHQSDVVRKQLAGLDPHSPTPSERQAALYSGSMSHQTYEELYRRGAESLGRGRSVILDATFLRRQYRKRAIDLAEGAAVPVIIVECSLDETEQLARLKTRYESAQSESDAGPELLAQQRHSWQPVRQDEGDMRLTVNTSGAEAVVRQATLRVAWHALLSVKPQGPGSGVTAGDLPR